MAKIRRSPWWVGLMGTGLLSWMSWGSALADEAGIGHSLDPKVEQVLIRGMERGIKGDYSGAILDFSEVIRHYPTLADAYFNRGLAYQKQGDLSQAIADFSQTLVLDPQFAEAYLARGKAYVQLNDRDRALQDLRSAAAAFQQQGRPGGYRQAMDAIAPLTDLPDP